MSCCDEIEFSQTEKQNKKLVLFNTKGDISKKKAKLYSTQDLLSARKTKNYLLGTNLGFSRNKLFGLAYVMCSLINSEWKKRRRLYLPKRPKGT